MGTQKSPYATADLREEISPSKLHVTGIQESHNVEARGPHFISLRKSPEEGEFRPIIKDCEASVKGVDPTHAGRKRKTCNTTPHTKETQEALADK
jgi:hypothetical protein